MKKMMFRSVTLLLLVASLMTCCAPAACAADSYTCSAYTECTANGGEIYVITKDNCPIRKKPNNKGKVVARGTKGQLVSVNRVFWTAKFTRWCEINVVGSNEKYYIYTGNCEPHTTHSFVSIFDTANGTVEFCAVCGMATASAGGKTATCDLTCVADQATKGSFSTYDASFTSVAAQVVVGEIPFVGTAADVRDLIGDILNGEEAWVIGLDCVGLIPLVGALKYSDELASVGKHADELATVGKHADDIPWGFWSDYKKVKVGGKEYAQIGDYYYTKHVVDEFLNPSVETNWVKRVDPVSGKISYVEHSRGIPPVYINYILTEGVANGTTKAVAEGANRVKYTSGSLSVVVENGNTVVTVFSK